MESTEDLEDWNMRLPTNKLDLVGVDHVYEVVNSTDTDKDGTIEKSEMNVLEYNKSLKIHQDTVETNCRRIIKGLASGALEMGAVSINTINLYHF